MATGKWIWMVWALTLYFAALPSSALAAKRKTARKSSHTAVSRSRRAPARSTARKGRASLPSGPGSERYKEIQQALLEKGYYQGEVNGQWGPESVDALKRFQSEQNLTSDGKLNSLSLIALGLGPKRSPAGVRP